MRNTSYRTVTTTSFARGILHERKSHGQWKWRRVDTWCSLFHRVRFTNPRRMRFSIAHTAPPCPQTAGRLRVGTACSVQLRDARTGQRLHSEFAEADGWARALEFSPDGRLILVNGPEQARLWD